MAKLVILLLSGALTGIFVAFLKCPLWFALPFAAVPGVVAFKAAKKSWITNGSNVDRLRPSHQPSLHQYIPYRRLCLVRRWRGRRARVAILVAQHG